MSHVTRKTTCFPMAILNAASRCSLSAAGLHIWATHPSASGCDDLILSTRPCRNRLVDADSYEKPRRPWTLI